MELWNCGIVELWIRGACRSAESVDLWSPVDPQSPGSVEPRLCRAQDLQSPGSTEPGLRGASHIGVVDPVLWILLSL